MKEGERIVFSEDEGVHWLHGVVTEVVHTPINGMSRLHDIIHFNVQGDDGKQYYVPVGEGLYYDSEEDWEEVHV